MTNVVSIGATCEYLVSRAARHRRAGRYDEAMVLLTKARAQFGFDEEIELEKARIYDEIGCDEEAARSYFRVVRAEGKHKAEALFSLALSNAQHADINRAISCFQLFTVSDRQGISDEKAMLLGKQLLEEIEPSHTRSRKDRTRMLERRAAQLMQQGKITAAKRAVRHAIALHPCAQNYTLLSCCCLLKNEIDEAVQSAQTAHELSPARVQTMCVLADALMMSKEVKQAHRMIHIASMRAKTEDDLLAAAIECAKYGMDTLALRLAKQLLCKAPYHLRAMTLCAGALSNMGRIKQASKVFGRIAGLLPENSVPSFYYRLTKDGIRPQERIGLGLDVPREEGIERAKALITKLYNDPEKLNSDKDQLCETIMLCDWALHSPLAGSHSKTVALIILGALEAEEARELMLDLLTESQIAQSVKMAVLQMLTAREGFKPYLVDMDGRLVCLAAGAVTQQPVKCNEANSRCVQKASDALSRRFPDAPQKMLDFYLGYINAYGEPKRREESAIAAALEYAYHVYASRTVQIEKIAKRYGISRRLCGIYIRRILKSNTLSTTNREL